MNAAPDSIAQSHNGTYPGAAIVKIVLAWIVTGISWFISHLPEINTLVQIAAGCGALAFTIWQWRKAAKKS